MPDYSDLLNALPDIDAAAISAPPPWLVDCLAHRFSLRTDSRWEEAHAFFEKHPGAWLPVCGEDGKPIGVINADICRQVHARQPAGKGGLGFASPQSRKKSISEAMVSLFDTIAVDAPIEQVLTVLGLPIGSDDHPHALLVLQEDDRLTGVADPHRILTVAASQISSQKALVTRQHEQVSLLQTQVEKAATNLEKLTCTTSESLRTSQLRLAAFANKIQATLRGFTEFAHLLLDTDLDHAERAQVQTIASQSSSLCTLAENIADLSGLECVPAPLSSEMFELLDALEESLCASSAKITEKKVELLCRIPQTLPRHLSGDRARLIRMVSLLLECAASQTASGTLTLNLQIIKDTPQQSLVELDIFTTWDETQNTVPDPTGHDLIQPASIAFPLCNHWAEQMGGSLSTERQPSKDLVYRLTLPFEKVQPTQEASRQETLWGIRALLVEPVPAHREVLTSWLSSWSMAYKSCPDPNDAATWTSTHAEQGAAFNLIILAHHPGILDALSLARTLKKLPAAQKSKVVLLCHKQTQPSPAEITKAGIDAVLYRPVTAQSLHDTLAKKAVIHPAAPAQAQPATSTHPLTVLVVDDSSANQEIAKALLEKLGHHPLIAGNGQEALDLLALQPVDAVLMDCHMPVMDGIEATRRIRSGDYSSIRRTIPIIALNASSSAAEKSRFTICGVNDFLAKPLIPSALSKILSKIVSSVTPTARAEPLTAPPPHPSIEEMDEEELALEAAKLAPPSPPKRPKLDLPPFLIEMFLKETSQRLGELDAALANQDIKTVTRIAHTIKGSASNFEADRLVKICQTIEKMGRDNDISQVPSLLPEVRAAYDETLAQLQSDMETPQ